MKVLHFILGKAAKERANGVNQVVAGLSKYSARLGADVRVIGKTHSVLANGERIPRDGFAAEVYPQWGVPLRNALTEGIRWADVVHLHGGFSPWNILVGRMCDQHGRPYLVTLHNVLSPELGRARGRIKKAIFHSLLQRRHLERAAALHVLTDEEATDVFSAVRPRSIFCVPNGVDLDDYTDAAELTRSRSTLNMGYLGRLSPEKNLDALCHAFARVNADGQGRLRLAGPSSNYGASLKERYGARGIELTGPVYGAEKDAFIRSVDLLVLPSLSEGFPVVAVEALALRTPLLVTRTSKLSHFFDRQAFFMCEPTDFGLERGLRKAIAERDEWVRMAKNGRRLVDEQLNWASVAAKVLKAYDEIAKGSS
jgi:glycosyltransferase involved in cell wall biosynthesis